MPERPNLSAPQAHLLQVRTVTGIIAKIATCQRCHVRKG
jgi:hypothetical protein